MSSHVIKMPDLGEGIAEVEIVAWHVQVGDAVSEDQVLADVMTDKATVEIPSSVAGRVEVLGGEVGQVLAVGAELIRIVIDGAAETAAATASPPPTRAPAEPAPAPSKAAPPAPPAGAPTGPQAARQDAARSGPPPRIIASPALRARAWQLGIDLAQVEASGTAGRIVQADLDAHLARLPAGAAPSARPVAATLAPADDVTQTIRIIGLRRRIAQKMQDSKRRIPHYTYVEEVDVSELDALRVQLNERHAAQRPRLTVLPLLVRAIVLAVPEFPQINARFDDEAGVLTQHSAVHVGIATQTDAGLMVPVLRDAQVGDLWDHARAIVRLSEAARDGKAVRDELTGSTITITSLGKLGGIVSTPVINHPEVAIVGVNRIAERAVVRNGSIVVRQMMNLSSSFDHRVVDGAVAAAFIQRLRGLLEQPALLFID